MNTEDQDRKAKRKAYLKAYRKAYYTKNRDKVLARNRRSRAKHGHLWPIRNYLKYKDSIQISNRLCKAKRDHLWRKRIYKPRMATCIDCDQTLPKGGFKNLRMVPIPWLRPKFWRCMECEAEVDHPLPPLSRSIEKRKQQLANRGWFYYDPCLNPTRTNPDDAEDDAEDDDDDTEGCDDSMVQRVLTAFYQQDDRTQTIFKAIASGKTLTALSIQLKISRARVYQIIKETRHILSRAKAEPNPIKVWAARSATIMRSAATNKTEAAPTIKPP
jgi:hypothetical protein